MASPRAWYRNLPDGTLRTRGLLLAILALCLILDSLALVTAMVLGDWVRSVELAVGFVLAVALYLTVKDFQP
jgi:hypothetical protein